jgi:hypothetical protein
MSRIPLMSLAVIASLLVTLAVAVSSGHIWPP